ncbi:MAG: tail fiber domain-containing protein [Pontimonas sp.]
MSYGILSSNLVLGLDAYPQYSFVATGQGLLQVERLDGLSSTIQVDGCVSANSVQLNNVTSLRTLVSDGVGRIVESNVSTLLLQGFDGRLIDHEDRVVALEDPAKYVYSTAVYADDTVTANALVSNALSTSSATVSSRLVAAAANVTTALVANVITGNTATIPSITTTTLGASAVSTSTISATTGNITTVNANSVNGNIFTDRIAGLSTTTVVIDRQANLRVDSNTITNTIFTGNVIGTATGGNINVVGNIITGNTILTSNLSPIAFGNILISGNIVANDVHIKASDPRLKRDVAVIRNAMESIRRINGVRFQWRDDIPNMPYRGRDVGLLADQVRSVLPEAITLAAFDRDAAGRSISGECYLGVDGVTNKLTALIVQALHEIDERLIRVETMLKP